MKEYYVTGAAKFQAEWEEKCAKLWSELTVKEQRLIVPIQPPYTEERVVAFLAELRKTTESRRWSVPSLFQKKVPFPTSGVRYWKMVEIPGKNYSIGKYPVTQALWERVMGKNPSHFKGSNRPVERVSWLDCVLFCNKLSEMEGLEKVYTLPDGLEQELHDQTEDSNVEELSKEVSQNREANGYRLPTEVEWEYAARGGEHSLFSGGDDLAEVAWVQENSDWRTHSVGQKQCNGFALFDMSGNVDEWCWDWDEYDHPDIPTEGISGPSTGTHRVFRGGSWLDDERNTQLSSRNSDISSRRCPTRGVRLCRTIR